MRNRWRVRCAVALALLAPGLPLLAETFPTYGVAAEGPTGWVGMPRDRGNRVARWARVDAAGKPTHILLVDAGKPVEPTIDATAQALASRFKGRVAEKPVEVDGARAVRVEADHAGRGLQPVEIIVTDRGGLRYFIFGGLEEAGSCHDAVEQVRRSWKWVQRLPPVKCLDDRSALRLPEMGLHVRIPRSAAIVPGVKGRPSLHVALRDPAEVEDEALFMTQVAPLQPGVTFAQTVDTFRQGWNAKGLTESDLVWETDDVVRRTVVSNVLTLKERSPNGKTGRALWALRQLGSDSIVLVNFTLATEDADEIAGYAKFAAEFVRDVEKQPREK